jgi:hypothetical protein
MADLTLTEKRASGWFWRIPACLDLVQPALTDDAVRSAEAQLAVKLPAPYLELLQQQNGGYLRATWPASYAGMLYGIGPGPASLTLDEAPWRPHNARSSWKPRKPELLIPFDGGEHWSMCFDYRKQGPQGEPSITLVDAEAREDEPVAKNFLSYLGGLADRLQGSTRLYGELTAEDVAQALARQLGSSAPHKDNGAHGYLTWRIALRGDHQWCFLSANRVPAGYRRNGSQRVNVTSEMALQLPEDPACSVLLSCTQESRKLVMDAAQALALRTSP